MSKYCCPVTAVTFAYNVWDRMMLGSLLDHLSSLLLGPRLPWLSKDYRDLDLCVLCALGQIVEGLIGVVWVICP